MKLFGQVEIKTILVPIISSVITGVGTFTIAKGRIAAEYESQQASTKVAVSELRESDAKNRTDIIVLKGEQVLLRKEVAGSVQRIEALLNDVIVVRKK